MLNDVTSVGAVSRLPGAVSSDLRCSPAAMGSSLAPASPAAPQSIPHPVEPTQMLDRASHAAARAMFKDRDVEVTSFHDELAGRVVYQVADRASGEVLMQSPPDALLRFFASTREALAEHLVELEA